jgi:ubiquitin-conjugating enzyme E2 O
MIELLVLADATIYGTVLTTSCTSRTCDVRWFTREGTELSIEHDVSVYDVAEHPDFVFNSGDIVVRMVPPDYCTSPLAAAPSPSTPCIGQVRT